MSEGDVPFLWLLAVLFSSVSLAEGDVSYVDMHLNVHYTQQCVMQSQTDVIMKNEQQTHLVILGAIGGTFLLSLLGSGR